MNLRLSILAFLLSLFAFADGGNSCHIECAGWDGDGEDVSTSCTLVCDDGDEPGDDGTPMYKADCENLKAGVKAYIEELERRTLEEKNACIEVQSTIDTLFADPRMNTMQHDIYTMCNTGHFTNLVCSSPNEYLDTISTNLWTLRSRMNELAADFQIFNTEATSMKNSLDNYKCRDAICNGNGESVPIDCPCTTEFNSILSQMGIDFEQLVQLNNEVIVAKSRIDNIYSNVVELSFLIDRATSPDDRMFEELTALWTDYAASEYASNIFQTVNLSQIFHDLQAMIRGDTGTQLNLTTEGVISLYSAFFDMLNNQALTQTSSYIQDAYQQMSNLVSRFFTLFNRSVSDFSDSALEPFVYDSFTNNTLSGYSRMTKLIQSAKHTNWFDRVELYLQSLNGWYSQNFVMDAEKDLEQVTESSITHSIDEATNGFSVVGREIDSITNFVSSSTFSIFGLIDELDTTASQPFTLIILPRFDVLGRSYGPIELDTGNDVWASAIAISRRVTSFLWRAGFLVLFLGAVYGAFRLVAFVGGWLMLLIKGM